MGLGWEGDRGLIGLTSCAFQDMRYDIMWGSSHHVPHVTACLMLLSSSIALLNAASHLGEKFNLLSADMCVYLCLFCVAAQGVPARARGHDGLLQERALSSSERLQGLREGDPRGFEIRPSSSPFRSRMNPVCGRVRPVRPIVRAAGTVVHAIGWDSYI